MHVQSIPLHLWPGISQLVAAQSGEHLVLPICLRKDFWTKDNDKMERLSTMDGEPGLQTGRTNLRFIRYDVISVRG